MSEEDNDGILGFGLFTGRILRRNTKDWDRQEKELEKKSKQESGFAVGLGKGQRLTGKDVDELEEIGRTEKILEQMSDTELCFELERSIFTRVYGHKIAGYHSFIINSYLAPRLAKAISQNDSLRIHALCNCIRRIDDKFHQSPGFDIITKVHGHPKLDPDASSFKYGLQLMLDQLRAMCNAVSR